MDPCICPDTNTLNNKLNIRDEQELIYPTNKDITPRYRRGHAI